MNKNHHIMLTKVFTYGTMLGTTSVMISIMLLILSEGAVLVVGPMTNFLMIEIVILITSSILFFIDYIKQVYDLL